MAFLPELHFSQWPDIAYGDSLFDAGEDVRPTAFNSIGGRNSPIAMIKDRHLQQVLAVEEFTSLPQIHRLFDDVTSAQLTAGHTDYRGIFIQNNGTAITGYNLWITQPFSVIGTISFFNPPSNAAGYFERVKNETTAPAGAAWTTPTAGAPFAGAAISTGGAAGCWFKRVITAGAATWPYDYFVLNLQATGETTVWQFFTVYTLQGTVTTATLVGTHDGSTITIPAGETYTLTSKNSAGAATDPPENRVVCLIAGTRPRLRHAFETQRSATYMQVQPLVRTGTGTFTMDWRPEEPGNYHLTFDVGGGASLLQRNVEVSPLADPV